MHVNPFITLKWIQGTMNLILNAAGQLYQVFRATESRVVTNRDYSLSPPSSGGFLMLQLLAGGDSIARRLSGSQYSFWSTPPSDHHHAPVAWTNVKLVWFCCSMCQLSAPTGIGLTRLE
jgi:hypothetical protein